MTGWRVGFAVGNPVVLATLGRIKANVDSGVFGAIQQAGIGAYAGYDRPEVAELRTTYHERAETMCGGLSALGFRVRPARATFYVWAAIPPAYDSMRLATRLLDEAAVVCVPGIGFGLAGEGYVRFAMTVGVDRIRTALRRMRGLRW
jgi:LL-diaminopimelate aminotransferase